MGEIVNFIGTMGMFMTVLNSATQFDEKSKNLDIQIQSMQDKLDDYKNRYNALFTAEKDEIANLQAQMSSIVDQINQISAKIRVAKNEHYQVYRTIQISGIIFIVSISFVLLCKTFGIMEYLNDVILWPFKKLF